MEGKSSYFILLVVVAVLSIALAFLAIGFFFFGNSGSGEKEVVVVTQSIPSDDELTLKVVCENKNFNLKKVNSKEIAILSLNMSMKYFKEVDDMKEAEVTAKIDFYNKEIDSAIGTYFLGLTLEDVGKVDVKKKAAEDLKKIINDILNKNSKNESEFIYSVILDWVYQ